ncbi:MAG TPA: glycosyltransferase family 4 protein [Chitinophagaceae bacterium]|nr:glycosyltransferase family 4 protein [Chitinophagaceae bacterium]
MKKVLIICLHRTNRSPGQRYRYEQYIPFLEKNGYRFDISNLLNEKEDAFFYSKGNYFRKLTIFLKTWILRIRDWGRMNKYDIIFIYRDALVTGSTFFEKRFSRSKAKVIYDFDDAIWIQKVSEGNKRLAFLKNPAKTKKIIGLCDLVFAGNRFLADYALQFNKNVVIIPSTIDINVYNKKEIKASKDKVCIGWTGSSTTIRHYIMAIPVLKKIKEKYGDSVEFKIIGDENYYCAELDTRGERWTAETEVKDLSQLDIGIMPLPDDEWEKGKCGMKGLQYMGLGIPAVMSPVGANLEIIQHGINGYLPNTENEWVDVLSNLIENKELRERIGKASRQTVIDKYSVEAWKQKYLDNFNKLTATN